MKTIKISLPLCAGVLFGLMAVNAGATEADACAKTDAKPETKHGLKIVHRAEAKAGKLTAILTEHTKKIATKTEEVTTRAVGHVENVAHKVGDVAKKVSNKVEQKIDNLSE